MQLQLIFLFLLFLLLFLISRKITNLAYTFLLLVFGSRKFAIGILSVILLPGTFIHEASHFIMATVLRIPTGKFSIMPKIEGDGGVLIGHLEVGKSDPFRLTLVGIAPLIAGLSIIYIIGKIFLTDYRISNFEFRISYLLAFYLLFITCQTMFSSRKDLISLIVVAPILIALVTGMYLMGIKPALSEGLNSNLENFLAKVNLYLFSTNLVNLAVLLLLKAVTFLGKKFVD